MKHFFRLRRHPLVGGFLVALHMAVRTAEPTVRSFDLTGAQAVPFTVQFSSDLKACAVLGTAGSVQYRNMETGAILGQVTPAPANLDSKPAPVVFGFIPPSHELLVGCGTHIAVHDPLTGRELRALEPAPKPVTRLQVSPDGGRAVAHLGELPVKGLAFWSPSNGKALHHLPTDKPANAPPIRLKPFPGTAQIPAPQWIEPAAVAAFAPQGPRFFNVLERSDVDTWDLGPGQFLGTWSPGLSQGQVYAAVALDDHRVAVVVHALELRVVDPIARTNVTWISGYPIAGPTVLEIQDVALSGDGRRLAVAGMRMKPRAGVFAPPGDLVYDVPQHGEVQVWDVATARVIATLQGRSTEKFVKVALDQTGRQIAAVHNGVAIKPNWTGAMQQSGAFRPTEALRVTIWDMPSPK